MRYTQMSFLSLIGFVGTYAHAIDYPTKTTHFILVFPSSPEVFRGRILGDKTRDCMNRSPKILLHFTPYLIKFSETLKKPIKNSMTKWVVFQKNIKYMRPE